MNTAQRAGAAVSGLTTGAGGCPGASVSVVCARRGSLSHPRCVPYLSVCVWCLGGTGCGVLVRCFYSGMVGDLPFVARVALLACIGGLEFVCYKETQ